MWIGDLHPVDFHENEIVQLFSLYARIQLRNNFADRGRFARTRRARDVNACAGAGRDGGFEVGVNGSEFGRSAWECVGD